MEAFFFSFLIEIKFSYNTFELIITDMTATRSKFYPINECS